MAGILEGLKVIDMGHFVAVPAHGARFCGLGAEGVKIEAPLTGMPSPGFSEPEVESFPSQVRLTGDLKCTTGTRKSMALNLKTEGERGILYRLVERSDVFHDQL